MSYRDDLQAAHSRIAALEAELRKAKKDSADTLPAKLSGILGLPSAREQTAPAFRQMLDSHLAKSRPVVRSLSSTRIGYMPMTFSAEGKSGSFVVVQKRPQTQFRGDELFAMDTSSRPGHGTSIEGVFFGVNPILVDVSIPTWMFYEWLPPEERETYETAVKLLGTKLETADTRSIAARLRIASAAMKMTWKTFNPGLDVTFQVKFHETCKWEAVLWGDVVR